MRIVVTAVETPALPGLTVGVQRRAEVVDLLVADGSALTWELEATPHRTDAHGIDLRGPYVHGRPGDRFLYLSWHQHGERYGRVKLMLAAVPDGLLEQAEQTEQTGLAAELSLVQPDGRPVCAAVRPPRIRWSALGADFAPDPTA